ncbi:hypothetical protein CLV24_1223 [Pontibacter ummariensis]|uniref:Uncharacterized protein n=1 Tax=Pontibacter ummariensis TaxID=1610492 RepID=A0A239JIE0_9BACT|nr:hypothetical protein [Pontibacter ummariensis]PRY07813.1 hypothetical protein CLV24_1223 [Pontibacter ummariensis]SNT05168.1 hypothetical protein SAMN06296052_1223 [Pontibacter ummariensis]
MPDPRREDKSTGKMLRKFGRIFALLMTLIYVALGLFLIFAGDSLRLNIDDSFRYLLGGIMILYGTVRFVRVYQSNSSFRKKKDDE